MKAEKRMWPRECQGIGAGRNNDGAARGSADQPDGARAIMSTSVMRRARPYHRVAARHRMIAANRG
ncbi:MAG: hypothetical protein CTY20_15175 [Hyphomicrobium sp.]|nr:MAG: hypothetical protein CTY20_15175 [Hyphomicrobium sp.]